VIASIPLRHPANMAPVAQFYADCAAGTLPKVSFVDSDIGVASVVSDTTLGQVNAPFAQTVSAQNEDEEGPADISLGENFDSRVDNAVLRSPLWPRILLVWTYDEHGGYYDHVPPPAAIKPDSIPPQLGPDDVPGGYDIYGPRVPAVVVSPYSRPHAVTNVVHDHTSVLATIEAKWNLPALTYRDANAATVADFLDTRRPRLLEPPELVQPGSLVPGEAGCDTSDPTLPVRH
jgi:phospholipase C